MEAVNYDQFGEEFILKKMKLYNHVNYEKVDMFKFCGRFFRGANSQDILRSDRPPPGWTYPLGQHRPAQIQLLGRPHLWKPK